MNPECSLLIGSFSGGFVSFFFEICDRVSSLDGMWVLTVRFLELPLHARAVCLPF